MNDQIAVSDEGDSDEGDVLSRCDVATLQRAVAHLPGVSIVSAEFNDVGSYDGPFGRIDGLPPFCDVLVHVAGPTHTTHVTVWAPLDWNGRFLATAGGGNRTASEWGLDPTGIGAETYDMASTLPSAVRRHYATASTDGGNRDARDFGWGHDLETDSLDLELAENWHHRATKEMADIAKVITTALYGIAPTYSYLVGTSGGGRQTLVTAQMYPDTFDGYWASCPAINWSRMIPAGLWPAVVMKEYDNVLSVAKFEAFRQFALETVEGETALEDGFLTTLGFPDVDATGAIGRSTDEGPITETDALVMNLIWRGPTRRNGERLWYGIAPGAESWGDNLWGIGLASSEETDGKREPVPLSYATEWVSGWLRLDPEWDWHGVTMTQFEDLFDESVAKFSHYDSAAQDFSGLARTGGRLLLTHSNADGLISPQGTVEFYDGVVATLGQEATDGIMRFFLSPGGGHSSTADGFGVGFSLNAGLDALIDWVENGTVPEALIARRRSRFTGEVDMHRIVLRFPREARHLGGDRKLATSFGDLDA